MDLNDSQNSLIRQLEDLWAWADSRLSGQPVRQDDLRLGMLLQLTAGTQRLVRGVLAHIRGGSADGLESHARTIIEAVINARYFLADETNSRVLLYALEDNRQARAATVRHIAYIERNRELYQGSGRLEQEQQRRAGLEEERARLQRILGDDNATLPNLEQRARLADMEAIYVIAYGELSQEEHMTIRGLDRYLKREGDHLIFDMGHDISNLEQTLKSVYVCYFDLLRLCVNRANILPPEEIVGFLPTYESIIRSPLEA